MKKNKKNGPEGGESSSAATDWKAAAVEGDTFQWQVKVKLPLLAKLAIAKEFDDLRAREAPAKRTAYLDEIGGDDDGPTPAQQRALDFLVAEEASVLANVLRAAAESGNEYRQDRK